MWHPVTPSPTLDNPGWLQQGAKPLARPQTDNDGVSMNAAASASAQILLLNGCHICLMLLRGVCLLAHHFDHQQNDTSKACNSSTKAP